MAKQQNKSHSEIPDLIKLKSVSFGTPPFRKLGALEIKIAPRVTLIAGRNGVGKSTILALIAGSSGITKGVKHRTYFGSLPNPSAEDILKLSYVRDFVLEETNKPHVLMTYGIGTQEFQKKGNVSGSEIRLRVVPRNEPKKEFNFDGVKIPTSGKVPIPTIYLGMMRVLPIGEAETDTVEHSNVEMHPDDYRVFWDFTNRVISTGMSTSSGGTTSQSVKGTKKRSVHPEYNGYDSTNVSLGQDSLSAIATALASFAKLKRTMGSNYRGGLLIIDELDAGFHPHAQIELLDELKSKSRELNIQVIATTHSLTMLEHIHNAVTSKSKAGSTTDGIAYLKGGMPVELLKTADFDAIYADMHLKLLAPDVMPTVKVYVEDEEAALVLNSILTTARKAYLKAKTTAKLEVVPVRVGCANLVGLIKADDHFKTVVIVLDGDTDGVSTGNNPNVVRLPVDPLHNGKQSPEIILSAMCAKMCVDPNVYPETRKKLRSLGASTDYLEKKILALQKGETAPKKGIEGDREAAKSWFNTRLTTIKTMKLLDGWVADNGDGVEKFLGQLEKAVVAVLDRRAALLADLSNSKHCV